MICSPLKTSSPRRYSINSVQRSTYMSRQRHLASGTVISPVEVPAVVSQQTNGDIRGFHAGSDVARQRRGEVVTSSQRSSVVMATTNGDLSVTRTTSCTSVRDAPFLKMCKAAYLAIKQSIAEDLVAPQELARVLQQAGFNPSRKKIMRHWRGSNSDGLTFSRFCDIAELERSGSAPDLMVAFAKIDRGQTGYISTSQLKHFMTTKGERMSEEEFTAVFRNSPFWKNTHFDYISYCGDIKKTSQMCWSIGVENMEQREKQYELNCGTYVIRRKDDAKRDAAKNSKTVARTNRTTDSPVFHVTMDWSTCRSRGCFYANAENGEITSHQFLLQLDSDTNVRLSIEPLKSKRRGFKLDMIAYVIRESDLNCRQLVAVTDHKDQNGVVYFEAALEAGSYVILPFTSGHPTEVRQESFGPEGTPRTVGSTAAPLSVRQNYYNGADTFSGPPRLSPEYREALQEMFALIDLDANGRISQSEFALFQLYTCDEEVTDLDWSTMIGNLESESGEMTLNGFLAIHQMELEHSEGNEDHLLRTLHTMGFDERLEPVRAFPYLLRVQSEDASSSHVLHVCACERGGGLLEKAICRAALERGVATKVRNLNDLISVTYTADHFATIIVQNKSHSSVLVRLDCTSSINCRSHRDSMNFVLEVLPKSVMIGHHMVKISDSEQWQINCIESVIK